MASKNIASTTDRNGNVFLLQTSHPNFWRIVSALPNENDTHKVIAVGQERYVRKQWKEFVEREKRAIATNYQELVGFVGRKNLARA